MHGKPIPHLSREAYEEQIQEMTELTGPEKKIAIQSISHYLDNVIPPKISTYMYARLTKKLYIFSLNQRTARFILDKNKLRVLPWNDIDYL